MSENGYASADDVLALTGRRTCDVTISGLKLQLQSLTAGEYAQVERRLMDAASTAKGKSDARKAHALAAGYATLIRFSCAKPAFSESDVEKLQSIDAAFSTQLASACMEHSGLNSSDLEDLAKNSSETAGDGSPTV